MKKYVVSLLLFLPMVAFGAPSVRMLGNQPALSAAISSGAKVTPVKASNETGSVSSSARIGTLSSKSKLNNLSSANGISSMNLSVTPLSSAKSANSLMLSSLMPRISTALTLTLSKFSFAAAKL